MTRPRVLAIGGLDPCGGAGITADARVLELFGCHPLTVAACLTVQNRHGFARIEPIAVRSLADCLRAAVDDGPLHAVKVGFVGTADVFAVLGDRLAPLALPVLVDPVLSATAGGFDGSAELARGYRALAGRLRATLTPNRDELALLAPDTDVAGLLADGCGAVVVKGGHAPGDEIVDEVHTRDGIAYIRHARAYAGAVHGTGCAFGAATVAALARGVDVAAAATRATRWIGRCLWEMGAVADAPPRPFEPQAPSGEA
ncbi:MAG: hydroxymethylpyrimidine/phosphomethylpyrimidine kinase [Planctomycetota bacterium]